MLVLSLFCVGLVYFGAILRHVGHQVQLYKNEVNGVELMALKWWWKGENGMKE